MTIFGLSLFAWGHVLISVIMLIAGFVVTRGLLHSRIDPAWTAAFIVSGFATSLTGFGFPFDRLIDSHYVAIVSLVLLTAAAVALYVFRLSSAWRWIFALGVVIAFYFDVLVAVAQAFKKIPALNALAPTASNEPAFVVAQLIVLAVFIWIGVLAFRRFRPAAA
jgi:lysylphosphatidylglycerol synthetase-like protein (DUF2156 family)